MSTYDKKYTYKGPNIHEGELDLVYSTLECLGNLEEVRGTLVLESSDIVSLGNLKTSGSVVMNGVGVKSLGHLKNVDGDLYLEKTEITSLGNLEYVDGSLFLEDSLVRDLGNLNFVGGSIYFPDGSWTPYFERYRKEADEALKGISVDNYPLYMNHENWLVRTKVSKFLETGEV
jgi:hypothetical protein